MSAQTIRGFVSFVFSFFLFNLYASALQWETMVLYSWQKDVFYKVTSEHENPEPDPFNPGVFSGVRMFDGNRSTCWAEGTPGRGIGEAVFFKIPQRTRTLNFVNGFAASDEDFLSYNRVKRMIISLYVGISPEAHVSETAIQYYAVKHEKEFVIELQDTQEVQALDFPLSWSELEDFKNSVINAYQSQKLPEVGSPADLVHYILRMEIQEVYKGSQVEATCVSEIEIEKDFQSVNSIYLSQDESAVLMDTDQDSGVEIDSDPDAVFQIVSTNPDREWLICIKMPKKSQGRVETEYILYNTFIPKKIGKDILGEGVLDMYGFVEREGKWFLEYFDSQSSQIKYLNLEEIELK